MRDNVTLSVLTAFAKFLSRHEYSTTMWENAYGAKDANDVCHELTLWTQNELQLDGEFLILWSRLDGTNFSGDNELVYVLDDHAYLIPNPFIEGDSEGFVVALQTIISRNYAELYRVQIQNRILYNAV
jgi:hypothetical protein